MKKYVLVKLETLLSKAVIIKEKFFKLGMGQAVGKCGGEKEEFFDLVQKAHRDWEIALSNFNHVTEPDLVDYYIYDIEAAEKKYVYYIKRARKENIVAERPVNDIFYEGNIPARCP